MAETVHQGDVLKVDKIKLPVLVVSKDFFNQTGEIIACPVYNAGRDDALHIHIQTQNMDGYVHCEKLVLLDLNARGFVELNSLHMNDIMNITDAIQGIFDYI
mgnify:FL=1